MNATGFIVPMLAGSIPAFPFLFLPTKSFFFDEYFAKRMMPPWHALHLFIITFYEVAITVNLNPETSQSCCIFINILTALATRAFPRGSHNTGSTREVSSNSLGTH